MEEKKTDIRPPLVGQATTSSNESSIDLHESNSSNDDGIERQTVFTYEPRPRYDGAQPSSESSDKNSNDDIHISQCPQLGLDRNFPDDFSNVTSADTSLELPDGRLTTSSPVSSLNSKRGLEWDNLGDVGYSNANLTASSDALQKGSEERTNYTMGSYILERIVSLETEMRFDPEGTTQSPLQVLPPTPAPNFNTNPPLSVLNSTKPLLFQLGKPNAESTPNSNDTSGKHGKDYASTSKDNSKHYKSPSKDHRSKAEYGHMGKASHSKDSEIYSVHASQGSTSLDMNNRNSEEIEKLLNRTPEGMRSSSSDDDPVTEYEMKQGDERGRRSQKNEGKWTDKVKERIVERYVKDHFERTDGDKNEVRRRETRTNEIGRKDREDVNKDGYRGKERRDRGKRGLGEVLGKYGRGRTRKEDIGGSDVQGMQRRPDNASRNEESEYLDAEDYTHNDNSTDIQRKQENPKPDSSTRHRARKETTNVDRVCNRVEFRPKCISEAEAVDQCHKINDHIMEIVDKYKKSLQEHRPNFHRTEKAKGDGEHIEEKYLRVQEESQVGLKQNTEQSSKKVPGSPQKQKTKTASFGTGSLLESNTNVDSTSKPHCVSTSDKTRSEKSTRFDYLVPFQKSSEKPIPCRKPVREMNSNRDLVLRDKSYATKPVSKAHDTHKEKKSLKKNLGSTSNQTRVSCDLLERTNGKHYRLFPHGTESGCAVRRTNSLEHMLSEQEPKSSTLPRYHSVTSLTIDDQQAAESCSREFVQGANVSQLVDPVRGVPYSASSSSLSTIITKRTDQEVSPRKCSKLIQASAGQISVTTQTLPCREDGRFCSVAHIRHSSQLQEIPSDLEADHNIGLIQESKRESKTNCNTLDSVGSVETVGSWVGKTYYNNTYERKPDGANSEDDSLANNRSPKTNLITQDTSVDRNAPYTQNTRRSRRENASFNQTFDRSLDGKDFYNPPVYNEHNVNESHDTRGEYSEWNEEDLSEPFQQALWEKDKSYGDEIVYEDHGRPDNKSNGEADNTHNGVQTAERSLQIDRVNSFEYLPGPVYEQSQATHGLSSDGIEEDVVDRDVTDLQPVVNDLSLSPSHFGSSSSLSSTVQGDVVTGVHFIQDLISNSRNSKKFIKHFVQTLIRSSPDIDWNNSPPGTKLLYRIKANTGHDKGENVQTVQGQREKISQGRRENVIKGQREESRNEMNSLLKSGDSETKSSTVLSQSGDEAMGEHKEKEDHTTSSEFFKPSPKVFNLQPSILNAQAQSTTLTSEDDSALRPVGHSHITRLRPLTNQRPERRPRKFVAQPLGSRSEDEIISKQEQGLRRLYVKQQVRNRISHPPQNNGATKTFAVSGVGPIKSILTNHKPARLVGAPESPPTLSSHISVPSSAPVGTFDTREIQHKEGRDMRVEGGASDQNRLKSGNDWRRPVTESEKVYDMKRRAGRGCTSKTSGSAANERLVEYLQLERQNQLDWIKAEIDHLTNLKGLLEKQETLKRSISAFKQSQTFRKTLHSTQTNAPSVYSSSEQDANPRPPVQTEPGLRSSTGGPVTVKEKGDFNMLHQDKASIYAHKSDKDKKSKVNQGEFLLPWEYRSRRAAVRSSLNLKRHMNEKLATSSSNQSDKENFLCTCLPDLYKRLGKRAKELTAGERRKMCKCSGALEKVVSPMSVPVGYVITFEPLPKEVKKVKTSSPAGSSNCYSTSESEAVKTSHNKTLQEYLEENRPDYVRKAEIRRQCLAEKSYLRGQQDNVLHKQKILLHALQHGSKSDQSKAKGSNVRRIFTTRKLRALTRQKYECLPEVQKKKQDAKQKEDFRTNRLMAEVFTKKLQWKTLRGVVDISNSDQVLAQVT